MKANKRKSQYFERLVTKFGKDWINIVSVPEIQKGAVFLFRDIAYDNIDKTLYLYAFSNERFVSAINMEIIKNFKESTIIANALDFSFKSNPQMWNDTMLLELIKKYNYRKMCYTTLYEGFATYMNGQITPVMLLDMIGPRIKPYAMYL